MKKPKEKIIKLPAQLDLSIGEESTFVIEGQVKIPLSTIISKILPELENEVKEFKAKIKKLKDTGSPIQIVDTSKNFLILLKDKYGKKE